MTEAARIGMTVNEYLRWDGEGDQRQELIDGVPRAMAPPSEAHGTLVMNLGWEIRSRLDPRCRTVADAGIVAPRRADTFFVADLAVTCQEARPEARHVEKPLVLVEVLSPSTEINDRGVKLPEYLLLPSLEGVLLVSSTERRVQLWRREGDHWIVQDLIGQAEVVLPRLSSPIPFSAIYLNVAM